jgi:hypothetical protein
VISSGDHDGPQPPEKQFVSTGISKTWTMITVVTPHFVCMLTEPVGHTRMHSPHPEQRIASTLQAPA